MTETITIETKPCPTCGGTSTVVMPAEAWAKWQRGVFLQTAWPEGSADDRELLLTGWHGDCWDAEFADEEDE